MTRLAKLCALLLVCGCGADLCSDTNKCPNDPKLTAAQIQDCKTATDSKSKCSKQYVDLATCVRDHQVCGSDGKTDSAASTASCTAQVSAYAVCSM